MHTEAGALHPTPPFDFARSLDFLRRFEPVRGEQAIAPGALTKAVRIAGRTVVFRVTDAGGDVEAPRLAYTLFTATPIDAGLKAAAADRIAFFLSVADDLRPFYAVARDDPAFAPVVARLYGYHQVKFLTPFENAAWAVLAQRTALETAHALKQRVLARFGGSLEVEGTVYRAFPEPAQLAEAGEAALAAALGDARKAAYLHAAAEAFAGVDERFLRTGPFEMVEAWLQGIKGVGQWSSNFILIRGLGRMERVPQGRALAAAIANVYGPVMSLEAAQRMVDRYGPYQGYWAHYLRTAGDLSAGKAIQ
ncbi:MAG: DNA-3-methyladenine glycosylase 2 family protein [Anaerolineae bacterium]|nr:DNA-3-methyladenine glycosylase 2 family protein [Anaerolineae bacterium]